ncbi:MAG: hypothetical protein LBJ58_02365, partial [Tannerellaceae bacterium]|jgi:hypothetical protein|nr:hypothetical protein [Tannerellaceae bacterium]
VLPLNPNLIIDGTDPATKTINDIIYLDNYWLGCQSTDVRMDWNCKDAEIPVATSYPGGWTAKFVGATPAGYQCISYPATNKVIIIAPDNNTGTTRRATIELSAGTLKQYIHLTQSPGSNTYVVQKGGLVIIPKSSANMDGVDRAIDMVSANWRFINSTQTTNAINGQGTFDFVAPNQEGVLIVEARSAAGAVYTWTVWVVENAVDFESPSYWRHHNGYTFMDRDLGNSIRYQWGRKDPDVVADRHISPAPQNMDEQGVAAILYTFITGDTFPYDWMTAGQKNNLWTTIDGEKAPYDPCPFGWRVPPAENNEASPLNGFTNGKNGMTIPNTGGLSGTDGVTAIPGSLIWGASARGADAYLYDAAAGSHKSAHRTDAYPVRCIRDVKYPGGSLVAK